MQAYGVDPQTALRYGAFGKPTLAHDAGLWFSISHAGDRCAIAVSRAGEVGVDIERIDAAVDLEALAERFFARSERRALRRSGALERRDVFETWTRREAVLKAVGLGLGPDADAFAVAVPPAAAALVAAHDPRFGGPFSFHRFAAAQDVVGTVAVASPRARFTEYFDEPPR